MFRARTHMYTHFILTRNREQIESFEDGILQNVLQLLHSIRTNNSQQ